jgi:hypothetical protein
MIFIMRAVLGVILAVISSSKTCAMFLIVKFFEGPVAWRCHGNKTPGQPRFLLVRDHPHHFGMIGIAHQRATAQLAFPFGPLGRKNVTLVGFMTLDLAGGSLAKALGCPLVCFHFRHKFARSRAFRKLGCGTRSKVL